MCVYYPSELKSWSYFLGSGPAREQSSVEWGESPSMCPYVCPFICPFVPPQSQPGPEGSQHGLRASQPYLRARQPGFPARHPGLPASQPTLSARQPSQPASQASEPASQALDKWMDRQMGGQTDGQTEGWKISPFYRTLSPIEATAPLQPNYSKNSVKRGKGIADHMMPLGNCLLLTFWAYQI